MSEFCARDRRGFDRRIRKVCFIRLPIARGRLLRLFVDGGTPIFSPISSDTSESEYTQYQDVMSTLFRLW